MTPESIVHITLQSPKIRRLILAALALLLIVLIGAGAYYQFYYKVHYVGPSLTKKSANYTYKTMESYGFECTGGCGVQFDKPVEFKANLTTQKQEVKLSQPAFDNPALALSQISLLVKDKVELPANLPALLNDKTSSFYLSNIQFLKDYISQKLPPTYIFSADELKAVSTPNIKSNAWSIDFSAKTNTQPKATPNVTPSPPKPPEAPIPPPPSATKKFDTAKPPPSTLPATPLGTTIQGRALIIFGKNATYYFVISAATDAWQRNNDIWQKVINSLKVDQ